MGLAPHNVLAVGWFLLAIYLRLCPLLLTQPIVLLGFPSERSSHG